MKYICKKAFLRLFIILFIIEVCVLVMSYLTGQFKPGFLLGVLIIIYLYCSTRINRRMLSRTKVRSRVGLLFILVSYVCVPFQILCILFQCYHFYKLGFFCSDITTSVGSYLFSLIERISALLMSFIFKTTFCEGDEPVSLINKYKSWIQVNYIPF